MHMKTFETIIKVKKKDEGALAVIRLMNVFSIHGCRGG